MSFHHILQSNSSITTEKEKGKMIAILLSSLLFILGLFCTFSSIPKAKTFLATWFLDRRENPDLVLPFEDHKKTTKKKTDDTSSKRNDELRSVFATFDKNKDGFITKQELRDSLRNIGISAGEKDVADMVEKMDSNGDGLIDFDEFSNLFESISSSDGGKVEADGELREAFDVFDGNRDGLITVEELGMVLSSLGFTEGNKWEDCKEMIRKVDMDGDGMVNFDEFKKMMRTGSIGKLIAVS